jgi:hypothetical protein
MFRGSEADAKHGRLARFLRKSIRGANSETDYVSLVRFVLKTQSFNDTATRKR